jgi:hypothetical protein
MSVSGGEQLDNEKDMTELTIAPDGRVFAFGTSRAILEVLEALRPDDLRVRALLGQVREPAAPVMRSQAHGRDTAADATEGGV